MPTTFLFPSSKERLLQQPFFSKLQANWKTLKSFKCQTHSEARGKRVIGVALPYGAHGTSEVFCHVDCAVRRFRKIADEPDRMGPIFENASESLLRGASVFGKSRVNAS